MFAIAITQSWMVWAVLWAIIIGGVLIYVGVYEYLEGALDDDDIMEYPKDEMYHDLATMLMDEV